MFFPMRFNVLYSVAIISIYCHASLAVPLLRRATPTMEVLVVPPTIKILASPVPPPGHAPPRGHDNLCSPAQVASIISGMAEAHALASAAVTKLSHVVKAEQSEGILTWLGACMYSHRVSL